MQWPVYDCLFVYLVVVCLIFRFIYWDRIVYVVGFAAWSGTWGQSHGNENNRKGIQNANEFIIVDRIFVVKATYVLCIYIL